MRDPTDENTYWFQIYSDLFEWSYTVTISEEWKKQKLYLGKRREIVSRQLQAQESSKSFHNRLKTKMREQIQINGKWH